MSIEHARKGLEVALQKLDELAIQRDLGSDDTWLTARWFANASLEQLAEVHAEIERLRAALNIACEIASEWHEDLARRGEAYNTDYERIVELRKVGAR